MTPILKQLAGVTRATLKAARPADRVALVHEMHSVVENIAIQLRVIGDPPAASALLENVDGE